MILSILNVNLNLSESASCQTESKYLRIKDAILCTLNYARHKIYAQALLNNIYNENHDNRTIWR